MMTIDVASLKAAIRKNPNDTLSRMALADAYEEQGRTEGAAKQREVCGWIERFTRVEVIKRDSLNKGSLWFDPNTMHHFRCRLTSTVYVGIEGIFFVSSEQSWDGSREYTVRRYDHTTGKVERHGGLGQYKTRASAMKAAKKAAGE